MSSKYVYLQFIIGIVFGSIIACSPTKFGNNQKAANICDASVSKCVVQNGSIDLTQTYKIGSGKVDILFVNDNSASMSKNQVQMAAKFVGFIQNLDTKSIDYRIAVTTTDLNSVLQNKLITFGNGAKYITKSDASRVTLFQNAIMRNETIQCEDLITSMFNTYGNQFRYNTYYNNQYPVVCPSADTRGIYTANLVLSENSNSLMRTDANLNIILISNDNVRPQGQALESKDTAAAFVNMMQQQYPTKYWDFNSIVVKDNTCKVAQALYTATNQLVINENNVAAIAGGIGIEYANLSNSAAKDIDGNPRPRGQILDICQSDYAQNFNSMSTQITQDARMFVMKCTPISEPVVTAVGNANANANISHAWNGDKIIFSKGTEGNSVSIKYTCYTGPT